jgi:predicted Zn-dependent protease
MSRVEKLLAMLQDNANDAFLQHALALEYIKLAQDDEAIKTFENLLAAHPDYVGSYYHLARLQEKAGDTGQAIRTYETGMAVAQKLNDRHAYGELHGAWEELTM